jgi:hypothetical protein
MKRYTYLHGTALTKICEHPNGEYVLHSDHEAAIKKAVADERGRCVFEAAAGLRERQHYDGPLNEQYDIRDDEAETIIAAIRTAP